MAAVSVKRSIEKYGYAKYGLHKVYNEQCGNGECRLLYF